MTNTKIHNKINSFISKECFSFLRSLRIFRNTEKRHLKEITVKNKNMIKSIISIIPIMLRGKFLPKNLNEF